MTATASIDLLPIVENQRLQTWLTLHAHLPITWSHALNEALQLF